MITVRCTRKLYTYLELKPCEVLEETTSTLGDWYANLISTEAGDLIMFVNERSLVTVAVPVMYRQDLMIHFRTRVVNLLNNIDIPMRVILKESMHFSYVQIAKTASKSILGSMNDIAYHYQVLGERTAYEEYLPLAEAEYRLSQMPSGLLDYRSPCDVAKELLTGGGRRAN
ncbi:MAG: hypothetical protein ABIG43_04825 [Chloroflexota bacterium]